MGTPRQAWIEMHSSSLSLLILSSARLPLDITFLSFYWHQYRGQHFPRSLCNLSKSGREIFGISDRWSLKSYLNDWLSFSRDLLLLSSLQVLVHLYRRSFRILALNGCSSLQPQLVLCFLSSLISPFSIMLHTFFFSSLLPMFLNSYFFSSVGWFFRTSKWSKLLKEIDTAFAVLGLSSSFMTRIFLPKNSCSKFFNMKQSWVEWETNWWYRQYSEWFLIPTSSGLLLASGLIFSCLSSS